MKHKPLAYGQIVKVHGDLVGYGVVVGAHFYPSLPASYCVKLASGRVLSFDEWLVSPAWNPIALIRFHRLKQQWWQAPAQGRP